MDIILTPFSWLLEVLYNFCGSYGLALILFALVVKVVLFPLSLKGKRSMIQMNMLQGQMQKLQKQYGKDRERYNQEVQKLYAKENVNPMGGCMWSFIPLIILMVLYPIIREPIHYMMGINDAGVLNTIAQTVNWSTVAVDLGWVKEAGETFSNTAYNQLYLASLITPENLEAVKTAVGEAGSQIFAINFDFLGFVDLSQIPQLKFWEVEKGRLCPVPAAGDLRRPQRAVLPGVHAHQRGEPAEQPDQLHHEVHDDRLPPHLAVDRLFHAGGPVYLLDCQQPVLHAAGVYLRKAAEEGL